MNEKENRIQLIVFFEENQDKTQKLSEMFQENESVPKIVKDSIRDTLKKCLDEGMAK